MFATVFLFCLKLKSHRTLICGLFLFNFIFVSEIRSDVLVLKDGQRIRANRVKMKNGNLVEFRVGAVTKVIEFSKVDSILPEFSTPKKPKPKPEVQKAEAPKSEVVTESKPSENLDSSSSSSPLILPIPEPEKKEDTIAPVQKETPFVRSRTSRTLQALVPGWSPLLLAEEPQTRIAGGILAFSQLYVLYRGFEFFARPKPFFNLPSGISEESYIPYIASANTAQQTGGVGIIYLLTNGHNYVITNKDHLMEKSDFYSQREFYGIAFLSLIAIDVYLSNSNLLSGDLKSVRFSTSDGGRSSFLSVTWSF